MISLAFHAIFSGYGCCPLVVRQSRKISPAAFLPFFVSGRGYAMWCVMNRRTFCQTRVERMSGELGGFVHVTGSRVGHACLGTMERPKICFRPRADPGEHALWDSAR